MQNWNERNGGELWLMKRNRRRRREGGGRGGGFSALVFEREGGGSVYHAVICGFRFVDDCCCVRIGD